MSVACSAISIDQFRYSHHELVLARRDHTVLLPTTEFLILLHVTQHKFLNFLRVDFRDTAARDLRDAALHDFFIVGFIDFLAHIRRPQKILHLQRDSLLPIAFRLEIAAVAFFFTDFCRRRRLQMIGRREETATAAAAGQRFVENVGIVRQRRKNELGAAFYRLHGIAVEIRRPAASGRRWRWRARR